MSVRKVVIAGAGGRDFHNFNTFYRDNPDTRVVAFTATQIPHIDDRCYPAELAGRYYPDGIPIVSESELPALIAQHEVDEVVFAYSDVSNQYVMEMAAKVNSWGADFVLQGRRHTTLKANVPVVSICAVRTGSGKSQSTRRVVSLLQAAGKRVVAIRHPMPYGDLARQRAGLDVAPRPEGVVVIGGDLGDRSGGQSLRIDHHRQHAAIHVGAYGAAAQIKQCRNDIRQSGAGDHPIGGDARAGGDDDARIVGSVIIAEVTEIQGPLVLGAVKAAGQ